MTRVDGWEKLLDRYVTATLKRKRKWGKHDCCFFVVDWIYQATGIDTSSSYKWNYQTRKEAYKLLKEYAGSFDAAIDKLTKEFGMEEIPVLMARRGDVAMLPGTGGFAIGIVAPTGRHVLVQGKEGLDEAPLDRCVKAWRVG